MRPGLRNVRKIVGGLVLCLVLMDPLVGSDLPVPFHVDEFFTQKAAITRELDILHNQLQRELGVPPLSHPAQLYIFPDARAYQSYVSKIPGLTTTSRTGLFVKWNETPFLLTYPHEGLLETLRHEFTHAVLNDSHPDLPLWLDEGLAEFYESTCGTGRQPTFRALLTRRSQWFWKPETLRIVKWKKMQEMGLGEYAEAWSWVYLLQKHVPNGPEILSQYLTALRQEKPVGDLANHLPRLLEDPQRQWEGAFRP